MDSVTARKILGVSSTASEVEVTTRYRALAHQAHPDRQGGDSARFVAISLAYSSLRAEFGATTADVVNEVSASLQLKQRLNAEMNVLRNRATAYVQHVRAEAETFLRYVIGAARSSDQLKSTLNESVSKYLTDISAQIESFIHQLLRDAPKEREFLYDLFAHIYRRRRERWLLRLYRHPMVVGSMLLNVGQFLLKTFPAAQLGFELLTFFAQLAWLPLATVVIVLVYLLVEYYILGPRRQFVPPRLSVQGIDDMIVQQVGKVGATASELATGGAVMGGLGALVLFPEPTTVLIATLLGSLFGLGGRDLDEMKSDAINGVLNDLDTALSQLDRALHTWCDATAQTTFEAANASLSENIQRLLARLDDDTAKALLLPRPA